MNSAELYENRNGSQFNDSANVLNQLKSKLQWEDNETIMDVGCGPGNVTAKLLQAIVPNDAKIVGVDISPNMVEHAQKKYGNNNLHFCTLDFGSENIRQEFELESFSKIFSFYCLHWIQNQRRSIENVWSLLKPNGTALIVIVVHSPLFTVYKAMSKLAEWEPYMKDVDRFIAPYQEVENPCEEYRALLESSGFRVTDCFAKDSPVDAPTFDFLKESLRAVNPFLSRMPKNLHAKHMDALMHIVVENHMIEMEGREGKLTYIQPNRVVVALCHKIP
nr:juvenile hormone acid O-methyltransferase [Sogatella furcifera]